MTTTRASRRSDPLPGDHWRGRVCVVSPHLDDAVLSLGASIAAAARAGVEVDVLTVLAGDPQSATAGDESTRRAGFATAGAAAAARRVEDDRACRRVGARPVWWPLSDDTNDAPPDPEQIRARLEAALPAYDAVLAPGFPLQHAHHRLVARLVVEAMPPGAVLGLYVEQPYASWRLLARRRTPDRPSEAEMLEGIGLSVSPPVRWTRRARSPADWLAKLGGVNAYESQLRVLRRLPRTRLFGYEAMKGGEMVLWCQLG